MPNILVLKSSILAGASATGQVIDAVLGDHAVREPDLRIVERDLGANPVPHLDADGAIALRGAPQNAAQTASLGLSDALIAELRAADTLVIGAPMYNFGIPTQLKSWFDHVLRAGETFRYSAAGPEGLLPGKRAIVVLGRGGLYSEGPASALDAQEPHLRALLGFMGISDVTFIHAEKLAFGPEPREAALTIATRHLGQALARTPADAA